MSEMSADPPLGAFLATLRRSRLLDPAELHRLAAAHTSPSGRRFADALVAAGVLTHYQADKLLRGLWQGLVLGPYTILAPLGRGGMGTVVYLARDSRQAAALGDVDLVALKLLPHRKAAADPKTLIRFRREMTLGRRANHPNVVRALASGEVDGVHYLALEYVPGRTLRQVVQDGGPLAVGDAARVFADVAAGLAHIHEQGLVHRDLKPANIMVRPDGRAVVLDLGLAYAPADPRINDPTIIGGRGYVVGTMDYIAPEQARDPSAVGPAADLYGMGCSLVYALTGSPPFPAGTTREKLRRHKADPPPALAHLPAGFRRIVHHLMAKDPGQRHGSAAEARDLLAVWATAAQVRSAVDAVTLADDPHGDAGLWEVVPGEELPEAEDAPRWELVRDLDGGSQEVLELPPEDDRHPRVRASCSGAVLLFAALAAVMWRVL